MTSAGINGHESVTRFEDKETGLIGFIAIHSTKKGPAVGGTRYWTYGSEDDAKEDALRLSKAMTYKCALARLPFGGGKGVILAPSDNSKKKGIIASYAKKVNELDGKFYTGEDVGLTEEDIEILSKNSPYIIGTPEKAGDPSPWAALGLSYAMEAALEFVYGDCSFSGKVFAVKGLGKVGLEIVRMIHDKGGTIIAADINLGRTQIARRRFPHIRIISSTEIHKQAADVYVPCALGKEFNDKTVKELKAKIICGAANNQLTTMEDGELIYKKGILYIPDYLANSGGLINVAAELTKDGYKRNQVFEKVKEIKDTTLQILNKSAESGLSTNVVADNLAEEYINEYKHVV